MKVTNVKYCVRRGLAKEGQNPRKIVADQLVKDGADVLHRIGGGEANTAEADPASPGKIRL